MRKLKMNNLFIDLNYFLISFFFKKCMFEILKHIQKKYECLFILPYL